MKNKEFDIERSGYDEKIEDIKKRKRKLKMLQDPDMIKRIKKDLKREQRNAKHSERNELRNWLKEEVRNFKK
jgi:hypothetical protein